MTFDLAENAMVVRAAEDSLNGLLVQATVDDVDLGTPLKLSGIGLASLCAGVLGLGFARHAAAWPDVTNVLRRVREGHRE